MTVNASSRLLTASRVVLSMNAAAFLFFAIKWFFSTVAMAKALGIELTSADAITDAQAVYGGLELGAGLFLAICAARPQLTRTGVLAATLMLGGLFAMRGLGIAIASQPVTIETWKLLSTDFLGTALNGALFVAWFRTVPTPPVAADQ